jgi:hypothetical protein
MSFKDLSTPCLVKLFNLHKEAIQYFPDARDVYDHIEMTEIAAELDRRNGVAE